MTCICSASCIIHMAHFDSSMIRIWCISILWIVHTRTWDMPCVTHAYCGGIARRFAPYWLSIHAFVSILCMKTALCVPRNSYAYDQDTMHIHVFSSSYGQSGPSMCILNTVAWHTPLNGTIFTRHLDTNGSLVFLMVLVRLEPQYQPRYGQYPRTTSI